MTAISDICRSPNQCYYYSSVCHNKMLTLSAGKNVFAMK
jgi:hypothetical protein